MAQTKIDFEIERDGEVIAFDDVPAVEDDEYGVLIDEKIFDELTERADQTEKEAA